MQRFAQAGRFLRVLPQRPPRASMVVIDEPVLGLQQRPAALLLIKAGQEQVHLGAADPRSFRCFDGWDPHRLAAGQAQSSHTAVDTPQARTRANASGSIQRAAGSRTPPASLTLIRVNHTRLSTFTIGGPDHDPHGDTDLHRSPNRSHLMGGRPEQPASSFRRSHQPSAGGS